MKKIKSPIEKDVRSCSFWVHPHSFDLSRLYSSKYYEIADLQLNDSKIGLRIKAPLFPYLDREVEALRWFIEQQEEYSIIADQIKMEGAIRGLNISLRKPYDGNELQMWNKAISNFNMKTVSKGSFSMGSIYGERDERPVHKVKSRMILK